MPRGILFLCALLLVPWRAGAEGEPDGFFSAGQVTGSRSGAAPLVRCIAVQPDGKILIGGDFTGINGVSRGGLARLNADGSLDDAFAAGVGGGNASVEALLIQPDGKILIAGDFTRVANTGRVRIARLHADGSLDESFRAKGPAGEGANKRIAALALAPDGKIAVVGSFSVFNGEPRGRVARLNKDGTLDADFGAGLRGADLYVSDVALPPGGKILICGYFTSVNSVKRTRIARLNNDGSVDESFGADPRGADGNVVALALQPNGKILVGGDFGQVNGQTRGRLARLNEDGSLDSAFSVPAFAFDGQVNDLLVQPDGKILVAGAFATARGAPRGGIARLHGNAALDGVFAAASSAPGADSFVRSLALQGDGKVLIGGDFTKVGELSRSRLARLSGTPVAADTEPPVITLLGSSPIEIVLGTAFADPGALVSDNRDAPRAITGLGLVDTSKAGSYTLTYAASDLAGNQAATRQRVVSVVSPSPEKWDFVFEMRHVGESHADSYLHSNFNTRKYSEWQSPPTTYWGPSQNGVEGTVTYRFPLGGNSQRIAVRARLAAFNFDWGRQNGFFGFGTGSCALWASKDGQSWVLLRDNPAPEGRVDSYVDFEGDLPLSLLGAGEIWLQVRMSVQGALNASYTTAQFSRSSLSASEPVFALYAKYEAGDADILPISPNDPVLEGSETLHVADYVRDVYGSTLQPGPFTGRGLFLPRSATAIRVNSVALTPDSISAYLPVTRDAPLGFDFGPTGVRAFSFASDSPILTLILDPFRRLPTYVMDVESDRGTIRRFTGSSGLAARAVRGSIRRVTISVAYQSQPDLGFGGDLQLVEGGVSRLSALPASSATGSPPVISLLGANPMSLVLGSVFSDPGAVVDDDVDGQRVVSGHGKVDTSSVGSYTVVYEASDSSRNPAEPLARLVRVVPGISPSIISVRASQPLLSVGAGKTRKILFVVANDSTSEAGGLLRLASKDPALVSVPESVPFVVRGKRTVSSPPKLAIIRVAVAAGPDRVGEAEITATYGGLTAESLIKVK